VRVVGVPNPWRSGDDPVLGVPTQQQLMPVGGLGVKVSDRDVGGHRLGLAGVADHLLEDDAPGLYIPTGGGAAPAIASAIGASAVASSGSRVSVIVLCPFCEPQAVRCGKGLVSV
jgi:hypothetical protein